MAGERTRDSVTMAMSIHGIQAITVTMVTTTILIEGVKPQKIRGKREDQGPKLQEVIKALENLNYVGIISSEAQGDTWYATTKGELLEYATPNKNIPVKLEEAVTKCRELKA